MSNVNEISFEHDGFSFTLKAQPLLRPQLVDDASESQRFAWALAEQHGIDPTLSADAGSTISHVVAVRYALRAETHRDVADELFVDGEWPSEVHVSLGTPDGLVLVAHAAAEAPPNVSLVDALREQLTREGPIGQQALCALEQALTPTALSSTADSSQIAQEGSTAAIYVLSVLTVLATLLSAQMGARVGGWERLGIALLTIAGLAVSLLLVDRMRRDERARHDYFDETWRGG